MTRDDQLTLREGWQGDRVIAELIPGASTERFERIREIGRGGMGRVFEAIDRFYDRRVALKEVLLDDLEARARFEREARITARLDHPAIVSVYDGGNDERGPFYVMPMIRGEPLASVLARATGLDQRLQYLPNLLAASQGIAHAHAQGVIHRDLKPANILVGTLGETIVIDWGLAKSLRERELPPSRDSGRIGHTRAGTIIGTPGFIAPEQLQGAELDERVDVYALGATLYYLLAGIYPPEGSELLPLPAGVPRDLVAIVTKSMADSRDARYVDAGGLAEDLRRFLAGQLVAAHHYSRRERLRRWVARRRALVILAAIAVVVIVVTTTIMLHRLFAAHARTEAALAAEQRRGDELVVARAQESLAGDPTRAVAILQGLRAGSPAWAVAASLLDQARAHGVAVGYPGMGAIRLAFDGDRVLASGVGNVMLYDLVHQTSRSIAHGQGTLYRAAWSRHQIVVASQGSAAVIDPATGVRRPLVWGFAAPAGVTWAFARDGRAFAVDAGRVIEFSIDDGRGPITGQPVPCDAAVSDVSTDSSGDWLAVVGTSTRSLLHRGAEGWSEAWRDDSPPERDGRDAALAGFAERSPRVAFGFGRTLIELDLTTRSPAVMRRIALARTQVMFYSDDTLFLLGGNTMRAVGDEPIQIGEHGACPVAATLVDARAVLVDARTIWITGTGYRQIVHAPEAMQCLATDPAHHYLLGTSANAVLAWRLDMLPAATPSPLPNHEGLVTLGFANDDLLAWNPSGQVARMSLGADGSLRPGDVRAAQRLRPLAQGLPSLGIVNEATLAYRAGPGALEWIGRALPFTDADLAIPTEDARVLVGRLDGSVVIYDPQRGATTSVFPPGAPLALLATANDVHAAATVRKLSRRGPHGLEQISLVAEPTSLQVERDGTVVWIADSLVWAWFPNGLVMPRVVVRQPTSLIATADGLLLLGRQDGALDELMAGGSVRRIWQDAQVVALSRDATTAVANVHGKLVVATFPGGRVATLLDGLDDLSALAVSPDGAHVAFAFDEDRFLVLERGLGRGSEAWAAAATNATIGSNDITAWRFHDE